MQIESPDALLWLTGKFALSIGGDGGVGRAIAAGFAGAAAGLP